MPVPVKRYFSTQAGAPALTGQIGSAVSFFNALLVDGFNPKVPTALAHVAGVATATCAAHGYEPGDVVALSGANEVVWNDEFRVVTAATNSFTFAIASNAPSPATGTFAAKIAPLGWTRLPFSTAQKAAYQPALPYCQQILRVWDDNTVPTTANGRWAKLRGYETMTDIDTGTGLFPTTVQVPNGLSFNKSSTSDATARAWWFAGDAGLFYAGVAWLVTSPTFFAPTIYGDTGSLRVGDSFCSVLMGTEADTLPTSTGTSNNICTLAQYNAVQAGKYYARSYLQIGTSVAAGMIGDNGIATSIGQSGLIYPHPPNNGLLLATVGVVESNIVRCRALPGFFQPLHVTPLNYRDTRNDFIDLPGRTLIALDSAVGSSRAQFMFDITGPWR